MFLDVILTTIREYSYYRDFPLPTTVVFFKLRVGLG